MIAANTPQPDEPEPRGGLGGVLSPTAGIRDTRLIDRAIREGWQIPPEVMREIPKRMYDIAKDADASPRNVIAASRVLCVMHGQNQHGDPQQVNLNVNGELSIDARRVGLLGIVDSLRQRGGVESNPGATNGTNGNGHGPNGSAGGATKTDV